MSGLDVQQLGLYVVRPTLAALATAAPGIDGPVAELLLLATAAQESQFRYLHQEGGPALGLWQMEPATHDDVLARLPFGSKLKLVLSELRPIYGDAAHHLIGSLPYACAMARLLYWRDPEPLPSVGAVLHAPDAKEPHSWPWAADALWRVYKRVYNTAAGAATYAAFERNYIELVAPHWPPPNEISG